LEENKSQPRNKHFKFRCFAICAPNVFPRACEEVACSAYTAARLLAPVIAFKIRASTQKTRSYDGQKSIGEKRSVEAKGQKQGSMLAKGEKSSR
jgi:hypothetical protein